MATNKNHKWARYNPVDLTMAMQTRLNNERSGWTLNARRDRPRFRIVVQASKPIYHAGRKLVTSIEIPGEWLARPLHALASIASTYMVQAIDNAIKEVADKGIDSVPFVNAPPQGFPPVCAGAPGT